MKNHITTERLHLDILAPEDHDFIQQLVNSKGWLHFIGNRKVHSKEDAINYVNKLMHAPDIHYWVVRQKENDEPVGVVTFMKRPYLEHFDIGFAFLPQYNGKGYAYEAASEVLAMVRAQPEYSVVFATTLPHNESSIKLITKLGMQYEKEIEAEGELLLLYAIRQ
jgi:RimJ/RimL family protein N-acetyltransferase